MLRFNPVKHLNRLESPGRYRLQPPELILPYLPPMEGAIVAELGCGTGYFGRMLARCGRPRLYLGLDPSGELLEIFDRSLGPADREHVVLARSERERLPLKSGSVSLMLLANVLHEILIDAGVIPEITRAMAPGGHLFIVDWKRRPSPVGPPLLMRVPAGKARRLFGDQGFRAVPLPPVYGQHYCLLMVKEGAAG